MPATSTEAIIHAALREYRLSEPQIPCPEIDELVDYQERETPADQTRFEEIQKHLVSCHECRSLVLDFADFKEFIHQEDEFRASFLGSVVYTCRRFRPILRRILPILSRVLD